MLAWKQYAYGCFNQGSNTEIFITIGPITGPSVVNEVKLYWDHNGFGQFQWAFSIARSSAPTLENFNSGVKLQSPPAESSVAEPQDIFESSRIHPDQTFGWPCWVPVASGSSWLVFRYVRIGSQTVAIRGVIAVSALRVFSDRSGVVAGQFRELFGFGG